MSISLEQAVDELNPRHKLNAIRLFRDNLETQSYEQAIGRFVYHSLAKANRARMQVLKSVIVEQEKLVDIFATSGVLTIDAKDVISKALTENKAVAQELYDTLSKEDYSLLLGLQVWLNRFSKISNFHKVHFHQLIEDRFEEHDYSFAKTLKDLWKHQSILLEFEELRLKVPYLFSNFREAAIIGGDYDDLISIADRIRFLNSLNPDDIVRGKLDYEKIIELADVHSLLSPQLLALRRLERKPLHEGHVFFPIVDENFPGSDSFEFSGEFFRIYEELYERLMRLNPDSLKCHETSEPRKLLYISSVMNPKYTLQAVRNFEALKAGWPCYGFATEASADTDLKTDFDFDQVFSSFTIQTTTEYFMKTHTPGEHYSYGLKWKDSTDIEKVKEAMQQTYLKVSEQKISRFAKEMNNMYRLYGIAYYFDRIAKAEIERSDERVSENGCLIYYNPESDQCSLESFNIDHRWMIESFIKIREIMEAVALRSENGILTEDNKARYDTIRMEVTPDNYQEIYSAFYNLIGYCEEQKLFNPEERDIVKNFWTQTVYENLERIAALSEMYPDFIYIQELGKFSPSVAILPYGVNSPLSIEQVFSYMESNMGIAYAVWFNKTRYGLITGVETDSAFIIERMDFETSLFDDYQQMLEKRGHEKSVDEIAELLVLSMISSVHNSDNSSPKKKISLKTKTNLVLVRHVLESFAENYGTRVIHVEGNNPMQTDFGFEETPYLIDMNAYNLRKLHNASKEFSELRDLQALSAQVN